MTRRPYLPFWPALMVLLAMLSLPGYFLLQLKFDNAPEAYLPTDAPSVQFERRLRERFPGYELEVLLFQGEDLYQDRFLDALDRAADQLAADPRIERVISVSRLDHIAGSEDGFSVTPLLGKQERAALSPEQRRARVLADRFAPGLVVSNDGRSMALVVRPKAMGDSVARLALHETIGTVLQRSGLASRVVARAGQLPLDVVQFQSMLSDNATFIPATIGVGLLLVWLLFRRVLAVALSLMAVSAVCQTTLALLSLSGKPFTLVTSILPPFLAAMTIASLVHFYNALSHAGGSGLSGRARINAALAEVRRPSFFAIVTTVAGLLSLATSTIQPIRHFGLAGALGMVLIFMLVIYVLPGLVERFDRRDWPRNSSSTGAMQRLVDVFSHFSIRRAGWVAGAFLLLTLAGTPLLAHIKVETNIYNFFSDEHPINRATLAVEDALSGVMPLDLVFEVDERDGLLNPERLKTLQALRDFALAQPEVDKSLSMLEILEEMHWAFNEEQAAYRRVPDNRKLIAQYLFLYDGRDLWELVNRDFNSARISLSLHVHDTARLRALKTRIEQAVAQQDLHGMRFHFASEAQIFTEQERLLVDGQISGIWASVLTIFGFMLLMCRQFLPALICMLVNVTPIVFVFMLMAALAIPLDMATALIACIAVGIAIDDTVHTYANSQNHLARGATITRALAKTYREAGRAVTITTIILCSQFLLLAGSSFIPTREFGLLTGFGLALAFLFDLLLMPSLLVLRQRWLARLPQKSRD